MATYPTITLDGFTIGAGTDYHVDPKGIDGLGHPALRTGDVPRGHADGSVGANDYLVARLITVPVTILGDDPDDTWTKVQALLDAWEPSDLDLDLDIQITSTIALSFSGRPGAEGQSPVELDLADLYHGSVIRALLTFRALDPGPVIS